MRKFFILFFGIFWLEAIASKDTLLVVQTPPFNNDEIGDECIWDFSAVRDSLLHEVYLKIDTLDWLNIDLQKAGARYYYHYRHDTLFRTGFENAYEQILFTEPIACCKKTLVYGDSIIGTFSGNGEYGRLLPVWTEGSFISCVDGHGALVLPNGQKHRNVHRVSLTTNVIEHIYDTTFFQIKEYAWFDSIHLYPLMELKEVVSMLEDDTTCHRFAYYSDIDAEDTLSVPDEFDDLPDTTQEEFPCAFTEGRFLPNPVVNDLTVSYHLTRTATIWFSLHSSQGIVMFRSSPAVQEEGDWQLTIPMSGYPTDDYVLYIHVDDIVLAETIIKM